MLTSITPVVYQGAVAPECLTAKVKSGESGVDLTTVTGITFLVRAPDGEEFEWSGAVLESSPTELTAVHVFAAGDTAQLGLHRAVVAMSVPGPGVVRGEPRPFEVVDQYGVTRPRPGA